MYNENIIVKDWRNVDLSFGLIYPNVYKIAMSSYSIRLLYFMINSHENYVCERIFLPERIKFPASQDTTSEDRLRSIENKILPNQFDILGFSIQFENDFKNILWILEKAGIPLNYKERKESFIQKKGIFPLIVGGGPVVTSNPMPLSKIFDLFFIGDSEPNLDLVFKLFLKYKSKKITFLKFLKLATSIEGIYVPSRSNKVKRAVLKNLDESSIPNYQLITKGSSENAIFEDRFFIEINRGCPFQCKFCISSFHNSPFRNRSFENITNAIEEGIRYSDFNTISLIGSCVSGHPKFSEICEFIINKGKRLSIPSIRIEHLTSEVIQILEKGNIKTITVAPETGSEKLRYELGKKISNNKIILLLKELKDSKIKNVKLYFLIGLPNETEHEIDETIEFLKVLGNINFNRASLRVSVNPLVPKLNTPYEKEINSFLKKNIKTFKLKYQKLEQELKNISTIKLKFLNLKNIINNAKLQALISLGDENICDLLINYYLNGANFGSLRRTQKELNFSIEDYFLKIKGCYTPWKFN
ncbi:MAG: radical SAM protein [Promethearchaeota archaeon]|nr:MAG: radical SAM protein [Candidatus Lokiarchaeota archaeon]